MFINRKSRKFTQSQVFNETEEEINRTNKNNEVEIANYPALEYILGSLLIGASIYLLYSAGGGVNGIQGFNEKFWWQFIVAFLPLGLGVGFILSCQIESLLISRRQNWIILTKTRMFCFVTEKVKKQFKDLVGISVVKSGKQQVTNITMTKYHIVLSFRTCEELPVLRSLSESKILEYFQEVRRFFSEDQISQKKVVIQNLLN